jgi:uncharacterized repeat protein (TIGR04076 family)
MAKVKITVVKVTDPKKLYGDKLPAKVDQYPAPCPVLKEGQEFIFEHEFPAGFCSWAFADIQRDIMLTQFGGSYPWIKEKNVSITCCSDGFRPVVFRVEKIEG